MPRSALCTLYFRICRDFARQLKINVWFRQGGYLFLVRSEKGRATLEKSVQVQNDCGLATRILSPREAQKIVPELSIEGVVAASQEFQSVSRMSSFLWPALASSYDPFYARFVARRKHLKSDGSPGSGIRIPSIWDPDRSDRLRIGSPSGIACAVPDGVLRFSPQWPNALAEVDVILAEVDAMV